MSNIAGIDLGTTFSALAVLNGVGKPEVVANAGGYHITPSALYFDDATTFVGTEAMNARHEDASRCARDIKRSMGEPEYDRPVAGKVWTPAQLSSFILKKLMQDCSQLVGEISDVVITVPAHFDEVRRAATTEAGRLAGLNVVGIVNEPTAAALYYATTHDVSGRVMVFDLGGGTFDVTILDVNGGDINTVCSHGHHRLGGRDFDEKILERFMAEYEKETGADLCPTPEMRAHFEDMAEDVKKRLSRRPKVPAMLHGEAGRVNVAVTREEFEEAIASYVASLDLLVEAALQEADNKPSDIDRIVLVGGSTRVPLIEQRLTKMFGFPPTKDVNVDECVALGAALECGLRILKEDPAKVDAATADELKGIKKRDVCNCSYGTIYLKHDEETGKDVLRNAVLIKKNTPIPCEVTKVYYTVSDGQEVIKATLTQGESDDPDYVNTIMQDELALPPGRPAERPIDITYSYDLDQRMHCVFKDVESGRQKEMVLSLGGKEAASDSTSDDSASVDDFLVE